MELSLRDVARFFKVSESTVARWVRDEGLPAFRVDERYRFNRVDLLEWASHKKRPLSPEVSGGAQEAGPSLADALEAGGVHARLPGRDPRSVLRAAAAALPLPSAADRELLAEVLAGREAAQTTGVGDGIAIPHARAPLVFGVERPLAALCYLERPVDFKAPDGAPVESLFLLVTPTVKLHLALLARVAFALHDPPFREAVRWREGLTDLAALLRKAA